MDVRITAVSKFHMLSEIVGQEAKITEETSFKQGDPALLTKKSTNMLHLLVFVIVPLLLAILSYFVLF